MPKAREFDAAYIRDAYESGIKELRSTCQDYWLNHAFLHGHQWLWFNTVSRRIDELPRDPERVRATINRIWPASRIVISKLLQRELTFEVAPNASDDATLRGAALAEAVLESLRHSHDWEAIRERNAWATWKGGVAAICTDWDPNAGSPVSIPEAEDPDGKPVFMGDTVETSLSIAEFVVEPGVRDAERARWWIKAQALPAEQVQSTYNLPEKPEADATAGMTPFQQKLIAEHTRSSEELVDLTLVLTYYERPNTLCPDGRIAVVVNNKVIDKKDSWPYPFRDKLNIVITRETPDENRWLGDTVVTMARPVQVAFNASWSSIIEHMKLAGNARLYVPQSSIDILNSATDLPGEMVPYADGLAKPEWGAPPVMPQWWVEEPDRLAREIDDILGVHDVSRGAAPTNIESGYGLSVLAEQDTTPVGKLVKDQARAWSRLASMVLETYAALVQEQRRAVVETPGQPPETVDWSGKDLEGQTQAVVPLDAIIPRSKAAMMAAAEKMVQMGLIQTVEEFATIADLPGRKEMLDRVKPDVARARRENALMALGHVRIPAEFDDHKVHVDEHNVFRKSVKYERLPDNVKQIVDQHIQAHEVMSAGEAGQVRAAAGIDPMLSTVARADGAPTLDPNQIPPEALAPPAPPDGAPPESDMMAPPPTP